MKNVLKILGVLLVWLIGYGSFNCFVMFGNLFGLGVGGLLGFVLYLLLFKCLYFDVSFIEFIYWIGFSGYW